MLDGVTFKSDLSIVTSFTYMICRLVCEYNFLFGTVDKVAALGTATAKLQSLQLSS